MLGLVHRGIRRALINSRKKKTKKDRLKIKFNQKWNDFRKKQQHPSVIPKKLALRSVQACVRELELLKAFRRTRLYTAGYTALASPVYVTDVLGGIKNSAFGARHSPASKSFKQNGKRKESVLQICFWSLLSISRVTEVIWFLSIVLKLINNNVFLQYNRNRIAKHFGFGFQMVKKPLILNESRNVWILLRNETELSS